MTLLTSKCMGQVSSRPSLCVPDTNETHETGTQAGDGAEMRSVLETFAPDVCPKRNEEQALYVGLAKGGRDKRLYSPHG